MMQSFRQWVASKKEPLKKYQLLLAREREREGEQLVLTGERERENGEGGRRQLAKKKSKNNNISSFDFFSLLF